MDLYPPHPSPVTGLEESMWRLGLGGRGARNGGVGGQVHYPERPGEQDCSYYLRTGTCDYGERCRYNHPRDRGSLLTGAGRIWIVDYPERMGQPVCEYYMKTGTCKFGSTCKYHHPRHGSSSVRSVSLNYYGYPLRPGEKDCIYYMKTGQCKFGATCKFHHPQPSGASAPSPAPAFYQTVQSSSVPSPQYPPLTNWQVPRPSMVSGSYLHGSYAPMLVSPGVIPVHGWSPYPAPVSPVLSPGGQHTVQTGNAYGLSSQASSTLTGYAGHYTTVSPSAGPSGTNQREHIFPERPGQPECQFYMKTGDCKFGATCKYHHPPDWNMPKTSCLLSPLGYPLRPGSQPCGYYAEHGVCKFGSSCKFDHPIPAGTLGYNPSASSLSDVPFASYPVGLSIATMAPPSSSSSTLRPELVSVKQSIPSGMLTDNTSSGSVESIFSGSSFLPHSLIQPQTSTSISRSVPVIGSENL